MTEREPREPSDAAPRPAQAFPPSDDVYPRIAMANERASRRRRWLIAALVGLTLLGALCFATWRAPTGSIRVHIAGNETTPGRGTRILLDGVERCFDTACVIPGVATGTHRLSAEAPGFEKYERVLVVRAREEASLFVTLSPSVGAHATTPRVAALEGAACSSALDALPRCCFGAACVEGGGVCVSGRRCVACELSGSTLERWRVRVGELASAPASASARAAAADGQLSSLSVCLSVGRAGRRACGSAEQGMLFLAPEGSEPREFLVSRAELGADLRVELTSGDAVPVAAASVPTEVTAGVLCRGISTILLGKALAAGVRVTLYLEDAHYVEAGAFSNLPEARTASQPLWAARSDAQLFETRRSAADRFVLAIGPMSFADAQRLSSVLIERSAQARVSVGENFIQPGKPLTSP